MYNSPKQPKTTIINIQSPGKKNKHTNSSPKKQAKNNPFNLSINKLKKTFKDNGNSSHSQSGCTSKGVFDQIKYNHQQRIDEYTSSKKKENELRIQ